MTQDKSRKSWMAELPAAKSVHGAKRGESARTVSAASKPATRTAGTAASLGSSTKISGQGSGAVSRRSSTVQGLGLASEAQRHQMVSRLREQGVRDVHVLNAMSQIERHRFVDEGLASRAYEDTSLPIGHGQTISQPYAVAHMTEILCEGRKPGRVLEIGTGCGYQAAVLAHVCHEAYSIERVRALHDRARANLRPLRLPNLRLVYGDGFNGIREAAPFDGMLIAAAAAELPESLLAQLAIGGRAVAPIGTNDQRLCLIIRTGARSWSRSDLDSVRFVPFRAGLA